MQPRFSNADDAFNWVALTCLAGETKDIGGVDTVGEFGISYTLDYEDLELHDTFRFPLITTREIKWKTVLLENLWFLAGSDDNNLLTGHGVNIWTPWAKENGTVLCSYGQFWRRVQTNCGSERAGCQQDVDQVHDAIETLQQNPMSRRAVVSAWMPHQFRRGALVPCHDLFHLVRGADGRLNMSLFQRSCDVAIGLPHNISGYGFLHCMFAKHLGMIRGAFHHTISDCHIYASGEYDHRAELAVQVGRHKRESPVLDLSKTDAKPVGSSTYHTAELLYNTTEDLLTKYNLHSYYPNGPLRFKVYVT